MQHRENRILCPRLADRCNMNGVTNPYQKPLPFLWELLHRFTAETDTVAEVTAGSGSLAVACINHPRFHGRTGTFCTSLSSLFVGMDI